MGRDDEGTAALLAPRRKLPPPMASCPTTKGSIPLEGPQGEAGRVGDGHPPCRLGAAPIIHRRIGENAFTDGEASAGLRRSELPRAYVLILLAVALVTPPVLAQAAGGDAFQLLRAHDEPEEIEPDDEDAGDDRRSLADIARDAGGLERAAEAFEDALDDVRREREVRVGADEATIVADTRNGDRDRLRVDFDPGDKGVRVDQRDDGDRDRFRAGFSTLIEYRDVDGDGEYDRRVDQGVTIARLGRADWHIMGVGDVTGANGTGQGFAASTFYRSGLRVDETLGVFGPYRDSDTDSLTVDEVQMGIRVRDYSWRSPDTRLAIQAFAQPDDGGFAPDWSGNVSLDGGNATAAMVQPLRADRDSSNVYLNFAQADSIEYSVVLPVR